MLIRPSLCTCTNQAGLPHAVTVGQVVKQYRLPTGQKLKVMHRPKWQLVSVEQQLTVASIAVVTATVNALVNALNAQFCLG